MSGSGYGLRSRGVRDDARYLELVDHELRTPLTSIHAAAFVLRSRRPGLDEKLHSELVEDISQESDRLMQAVGDVLMLAQLDAGVGLQREPLLLQHLVPPLLSRERRRRPGSNLALQQPAAVPLVAGDESGVALVLGHLLAAAGTGHDRHVTVELRATEPAGAEIRVGAGAPTQSPALSLLGWYASRRVARAMCGRILVHSLDDGRVERALWLPAYGPMADD